MADPEKGGGGIRRSSENFADNAFEVDNSGPLPVENKLNCGNPPPAPSYGTHCRIGTLYCTDTAHFVAPVLVPGGGASYTFGYRRTTEIFKTPPIHIFQNHTHSYISIENPDPIIYCELLSLS
jgi:hypothetical protein